MTRYKRHLAEKSYQNAMNMLQDIHRDIANSINTNNPYSPSKAPCWGFYASGEGPLFREGNKRGTDISNKGIPEYLFVAENTFKAPQEPFVSFEERAELDAPKIVSGIDSNIRGLTINESRICVCCGQITDRENEEGQLICIHCQ